VDRFLLVKNPAEMVRFLSILHSFFVSETQFQQGTAERNCDLGTWLHVCDAGRDFQFNFGLSASVWRFL
jgi:hypothetical protein